MDNERIIEEFLQELRAQYKSPNTVNGYNLDLHQFFKSVDKDYMEVTFKDVKGYFNAMTDVKTPRTIGRKMAAVRSFYKWIEETLAEEGKQFVPPTKTCKTPKMPKRVPKYLTHEEVMATIDVAKSIRDKAIIMMLYTSGMRISEMVALNKDDVDWDNKSVRVIGKGNKERLTNFNEVAKQMILEYLEARTDNNPVLFAEKGDLRISKRSIQKFVHQAGKDAGIKKPVTPHKYRHSFGSHLVQNGVNIQAASTLLGHSSISTTQIYSWLDRKNLNEAYQSVFEDHN